MMHSSFNIGNTGIFFSFLIVMILLPTLYMAWRLYINRQRRGYLSLSIALIGVIVQYVIWIFTFASRPEGGSLLLYFANLSNVIAFIFLNQGVFQLYNRTRLKTYIFFHVQWILAVLLSLTHFLLPALLTGNSAQITVMRDLGIDIYTFLLIFFFFAFIVPKIGQQMKYQAALTAYFIMHALHVLNNYFYHSTSNWMSVGQLLLAVTFYFIIFMFIFERVVELMQAIYHSSIRDGLTGLYNRKFFIRRMEQLVQRRSSFFMLFGDIDKFKQLNDTLGHAKGDEVLQQVASICSEETETSGIVGRYGGEEIVMVVHNRKVKPEEFAERIRSRVEQETPTTISLGYCKYRKGLSVETVFKHADEAMYEAKLNGRNQVRSYHEMKKKNGAGQPSKL